MDLLKPEYNIYPKAGSSFGRETSEETRAKLSVAQNDGWFQKGHERGFKKGQTKIEGSGKPLKEYKF
jgi:hypothetical protein